VGTDPEFLSPIRAVTRFLEEHFQEDSEFLLTSDTE
jgi:hypothetical protein